MSLLVSDSMILLNVRGDMYTATVIPITCIDDYELWVVAGVERVLGSLLIAIVVPVDGPCHRISNHLVTCAQQPLFTVAFDCAVNLILFFAQATLSP